jgi:hypothetical protein
MNKVAHRVASYAPKPRSAPVQAKRRWMWMTHSSLARRLGMVIKRGLVDTDRADLPVYRSRWLFVSLLIDTGRSASQVDGKRRLEFRS